MVNGTNTQFHDMCLKEFFGDITDRLYVSIKSLKAETRPKKYSKRNSDDGDDDDERGDHKYSANSSDIQEAEDLIFNGIGSCFKGLEGRIGFSLINAMETMEADNTEGPDADVEFTSSNYKVKTTSKREWQSIVGGAIKKHTSQH